MVPVGCLIWVRFIYFGSGGLDICSFDMVLGLDPSYGLYRVGIHRWFHVNRDIIEFALTRSLYADVSAKSLIRVSSFTFAIKFDFLIWFETNDGSPPQITHSLNPAQDPCQKNKYQAHWSQSKWISRVNAPDTSRQVIWWTKSHSRWMVIFHIFLLGIGIDQSSDCSGQFGWWTGRYPRLYNLVPSVPSINKLFYLQQTCLVPFSPLPRNSNRVARHYCLSYRPRLSTRAILPLLQLWAKAAVQLVG